MEDEEILNIEIVHRKNNQQFFLEIQWGNNDDGARGKLL